MSATTKSCCLQRASASCTGCRILGPALQAYQRCLRTSHHLGTAYAAAGSALTPIISTAARLEGARCQALPNSNANGDVTEAINLGYSRNNPAPYKWSWQDDDVPATTVQVEASAVTSATSIAELTTLLQAAATDAPPRAVLCPASRAALDAAVTKLLPSAPHGAQTDRGGCTVGDAARLLAAYGTLMQGAGSAASGVGPAAGTDEDVSSLVLSLLAHVCAGGAGAAPRPLVASAPASDLASLLWALAELQEELPWSRWQAGDRPDNATELHGASSSSATASLSGRGMDLGSDAVQAAPEVLQRAVSDRLQNQDFLAPDLCRTVCALGSLAMATSSVAVSPAGGSLAMDAAGGSPLANSSSRSNSSGEAGPAPRGLRLDPELVKALNEEIRYQLIEFAADMEAADLGRLITGMWGLRLGAAVAGDEEYRRVLMKAVYGKTRSLVDKAAVDFALSRLMEDDPEARSMHYDSRWTHEELHWLPRRERDKRRIIKEGWYRTQWGGWTPGGRS